ncbi:hypothetical protein RND71_025357 [Anisodus tanguticus]|uniref:Thioredoxin domain-containing protein n=1 Tax=Anisodus tanguticus TaxID=243964 RepID=A0AAE1RRB1_9SOLA|nr:hypothetical protein RND71_025357 [Anisodus tanguticus]
MLSIQVLLFATTNDTDKVFPTFQEAAKLFKGKAFGEDFLGDRLRAFYKSDPIPEDNEGDVKIVVGNNFDDIVLDESKDVLLEIYAPWCGHCQSVEPTYNKLAKHLHNIESLVIAKIDGTTNEHPRGKAEGFPTLLFFPAGNKTMDPVSDVCFVCLSALCKIHEIGSVNAFSMILEVPVDADQTVVALYKFIKKHTSIPFKLSKPASSTTSESSEAKEGANIESSNGKDEL